MIMISVIVCTYNRERYIVGCLERLTDTQCRDYEVLVVDNNSTDNTAGLVKCFEYGDIISHLRKLARTGKTRRARTDHGHLAAV